MIQAKQTLRQFVYPNMYKGVRTIYCQMTRHNKYDCIESRHKGRRLGVLLLEEKQKSLTQTLCILSSSTWSLLTYAWPPVWLMMIAFITIKSGLVLLIEGLCAQICYLRFKIIGGFALTSFASKEKMSSRNKQLVQDLIPPPRTYIHVCIYIRIHICRDFVHLDSSGPPVVTRVLPVPDHSCTTSEENNFSESLTPNWFELICWLKMREARFVFGGVSRQILKTWH